MSSINTNSTLLKNLNITWVKAPSCSPAAAQGYQRYHKNYWYITIHRPTSNYQNTVSYFRSGGGQTSAHAVIENANICEMVRWTDSAWSNGNAESNRKSISLEISGTSEKTLDTAARYIASIWQYLGRTCELKDHCDIVPTACPGALKKGTLARKKLEQLARQYYTQVTAKTQPATNTFKVKVTPKCVNVYSQPTVKSQAITTIRDCGVYTITQTVTADGLGWGKLKSGAGWIQLRYTKNI